MGHDLVIRNLAAADEAEWRGLWGQYLAFYAVTLAPEVTARTWARMMAPSASLTGRVALVQGKMTGFALHGV